MRKLFLLVMILLLCIPALAITADDYYNRAAKKYVMEDLEGSEADLLKALQLEPGHEKANELLSVVKKELGKVVVPTPTTTIPVPKLVPAPRVPAPAPSVPAPAPPPKPRAPTKAERASELFAQGERLFARGEYEEAERNFRQVLELLPGHQRSTDYLKKIREETREVPEPPVFVPQVTAPAPEGPAKIINELLLLGGAFLLVLLYILIRLGYSIFKRKSAESRMQVCPDCKTRNPEDAEFCQRCGTRLRAWTVISGTKRKWFSKFRWKGNPFTLDVIPSLFTGYSAQVEAIMDKLSTRSGHILVYGEKGVGKTTLLRWLSENLKKDNHAIYIARPPINFSDMLRCIADELKVKGHKRTCSLYELEELIKNAKKPVIILLDEAHEVTAEVEQQMRSLGDIEGVNHVLAGLPECREKLKKDSPPFFDRVVLETYIDHLSVEETRDLIRKRIEAVGGEGVKPFTAEAIENIFKMSKGRPRMILKVCDWVIAEAIKNDLDVIGVEVGKDFPAGETEAPPAEEKKV